MVFPRPVTPHGRNNLDEILHKGALKSFGPLKNCRQLMRLYVYVIGKFYAR